MSKKILLIDDERDFVEMLSFALKAYGFLVSNAADGSAGITKAKAELPDLIILDLMMPGMDGYEAARRLKSDKATADIPIIVLTAAVTKELDRKVREVKAADCMTKPCDLDELLKKVKSILGDSHTGF